MSQHSNELQKNTSSELIFALDIGTRNVIGIVGRRDGDIFNVEHMEQRPHTKRAMYDGQIEDIEQVASVISEVKEGLEKKLGTALHEVCVAAAGRSLHTATPTAEETLNPHTAITEELAKTLELSAIATAQQEIATRDDMGHGEDMLCVGYSVINYFLDDYRMSQVVGHKGKSLKVELIATFLPAPVVDSLRAATSMAGLSIRSMTLEPIAASNAVIPKELRLLNLALVDVGAGTSDIAISDNGSITAYTMATVAGDEVTESLMRAFLLDFNEAERVKQLMTTESSSIQLTDILGNTRTEDIDTLMTATEDTVRAMAAEIASRIASCSRSTPVAVFLVGGGSKSPQLNKFLAEALSLDESKIAIGGSNYMKRQTAGNVDGGDPELATPIGIAITAMLDKERDRIMVTVNGKKLRLDRATGCTVMNALLLSGIKYSSVMGKRGKSVTFTLNGERVIVRGGESRSANITVGGKQAHISTELQPGDVVQADVFEQGGDAVVHISDYVELWQDTVTVDGRAYSIGISATVNGQPAEKSAQIQDFDEVETISVLTLDELLDRYSLPKSADYYSGTTKLTGDYALPRGANITSRGTAPKKPETTGKSLQAIRITLNGNQVLLPNRDGAQYSFIDLFSLVEIDPDEPLTGAILRHNGKEIDSYLQPLSDGDVAEIILS